eukprot:s4528_g4.t1
MIVDRIQHWDPVASVSSDHRFSLGKVMILGIADSACDQRLRAHPEFFHSTPTARSHRNRGSAPRGKSSRMAMLQPLQRVRDGERRISSLVLLCAATALLSTFGGSSFVNGAPRGQLSIGVVLHALLFRRVEVCVPSSSKWPWSLQDGLQNVSQRLQRA